MPRSYSLENTRNIGIMAHIDAGKQPQPNEYSTTRERHTKWVRPTKVTQPWTSWFRSRKEVSPYLPCYYSHLEELQSKHN